MTLKFIQRINILIFLLAVACLPAYAQSDKGVVVDEIIAKVDNNIILKSELEQAYLQYTSSGRISGQATKCQILESLVINKLMVAKAEIDSVVVTDEEVEDNLNRRMQIIVSRIGSEEKIEEYYGKTLDQFKNELRDQVKEQLIVQKMQSTISSSITVTPSEVRDFFNSIPRDSLPYFSTEVSLAQIVKEPSVSEEQKDIVRKKLMALRERILNGEDFNELARRYSEEPGASRSGGELGFQSRGDLVPPYEAAALKLEPGELSQPVESEFGFHLIQLIERRGNTYNSRHILMKPTPSEEDVKAAVGYLDSLRIVIQNDSISFEKAAKEYSDDPATSASGGYFLNDQGAPRVSTKELNPVIFFTIDTMKVGTISKPLVFSQEDGEQAVRILYYESKIRPHLANLREDYQKIYMATKNAKENKVLNEWFEEAKEDVFINIDPEYDNCHILQ